VAIVCNQRAKEKGPKVTNIPAKSGRRVDLKIRFFSPPVCKGSQTDEVEMDSASEKMGSWEWLEIK